MANFWALNFSESSKWCNANSLVVLYSQNYVDAMRGHYRESSDCSRILPKNPYLNQATQTHTFQVFLLKKSWNGKFRTQKILSSSPSLEVESTPLGLMVGLATGISLSIIRHCSSLWVIVFLTSLLLLVICARWRIARIFKFISPYLNGTI